VVTPAITPTEPEDDDSSVIFLTEEEFEQAIANSLRALGCTYEELKEQARTRTFQSWAAHRTWLVLRGLLQTVPPPT
jgi:hypothetical protein